MNRIVLKVSSQCSLYTKQQIHFFQCRLRQLPLPVNRATTVQRTAASSIRYLGYAPLSVYFYPILVKKTFPISVLVVFHTHKSGETAYRSGNQLGRLQPRQTGKSMSHSTLPLRGASSKACVHIATFSEAAVSGGLCNTCAERIPGRLHCL